MDSLTSEYVNSGVLTGLTSVLLVLIGIAQVVVSTSQKKQARIALVSQFREQWNSFKKFWGMTIYIGGSPSEYYQILNPTNLDRLRIDIQKHTYSAPTTWALEGIQKVSGTLSEICIRILQGHLEVADAYPIFGTEFLRHTKPLRVLLDNQYALRYTDHDNNTDHLAIRSELQQWLIYHDGLRRRCLILIDLLWAEAARLEDLPPNDLQAAADAKIMSGKISRSRLFNEVLRLNGFSSIFTALSLRSFLGHSEYKSAINLKGLSRKRIDYLDKNWTDRLLG